ncbi:short-chain dehydrogenase [Artomyces pyxidatus]|uniref:Short-chain dehydrogenase n=1 Tax=Artomyces pyxidatus TaxID=48021 RepID=A0ACB8TJN8_9AGAM|nr:short-chain dehydrogenase [Artomyces pyxidatus]
MPNPVVIVTGASKGLGLAIASILIQDLKASVVSISRSRTYELEVLAAAHPGSLDIVECSVTDEPAVTSAIASVAAKFGRIDALVLNAGVVDPMGRIEAADIKLDAWRAHFDINFFSLVTALRAALPSLRQSRGRAIFVSSGAAVGNIAGWGPYNASKAAMNSLTRTLAEEEKDIVALAVRPGKVDTSMQLALRETGGSHMAPSVYESFVRDHAEGNLLKPEDPGYVIAKLALEAPASMSGGFVSWDSEQCKEYRRPS